MLDEDLPTPTDEPAERRRDPPSRRPSLGSINSTRSLHPEDLDTVIENGRTYPNSYYFMPCDALEQTRLSILHRIYLHMLDGELTTVPLSHTVQRVLDVGAGPGDWAVAMAQAYPSAEVVAVDIAVWDVEATEEETRQVLIQQGLGEDELCEVVWEIDDLDIWGPEDLPAEILHKEEGLQDEELVRSVLGLSLDDRPAAKPSESSHTANIQHEWYSKGPRNTSWNYSEPFDFIHIRGMRGAFANWQGLYTECFRNLVPGGWIEVIEEMYLPLRADSALKETFIKMHHATNASGYPQMSTHLDRDFFDKAGFEDFQQHTVDVPLGTWPEDEHMRSLGKMWLVCVLESMEASCLRPLTRYGGMSVEAVKTLLDSISQELLAGSNEEMITSFKFVRARKPLIAKT